MVKTRHYPHAPITEAIIDLKIEQTSDVTIAGLEKVQLGLESEYPNKKHRNVAVLQGQMDNQETSASASTEHVGFLFTSQDSRYIFQARLDGFSVSRLAPYENWQPFRDEARRLWNAYRTVVQPTKVIRMAVRYINRLDLPLPLTDLKDYLRTSPEISVDLPQELEGYFMQLRIPQVDIQSLAVINQAIIEPATQNVASIVLDIDLFRHENLPHDEDELWNFFETLHERKNNIFEACITDRTRELFN